MKYEELEKIELEKIELEKIELEKIITMIVSEASELDISKKNNKIKIEIEKSFSIEDDFENHIIRRLINNKFKSLKIIQYTTTTSSKIFLEFYVENDDDYFIEKLYERLRQIKIKNYNLKCYNLQQMIKRKNKKKKNKKKKIIRKKYEELLKLFKNNLVYIK